MFVLSKGDSFVSTNGITFDINEAILFQNINYVENVGDFKFAKVVVVVEKEIYSTPHNCSVRRYAAVTSRGEFIKAHINERREDSYTLVKSLNEASIFDSCGRSLRKRIAAEINSEAFFIDVYVKSKRVVKFANDHVKQTQEQFGPAAHDPLTKDDNLPF